MEVENHMHEACKSTCYEWTLKDKVEIKKKVIVVEKEELIMEMEMEIRKY